MSTLPAAKRSGPSGLTLTAPYAEGAILAIARCAAAQGRLDRFCTTLYWGGETTSRLFGGRLSRRRLIGIPSRSVWQGARTSELARMAASRLSSKRMATDLMYRTKERFDHAAAREIRRSESDVVVAMYAAALETFEAARDGRRTVLHFVNSHPRVHNALLESAGVPADSSEYVPQRVTSRVEAELTLADLVLVPSSFVQRQLLAQGVASNRVALIRYGVDPVLFAPCRRTETRTEKLKCLYVGQISWRKGIHVLIEAARILNGFAEFVLVGPLVSAEVLHDVPSNVVVKKTVSHAELRHIYDAADVFVLPSIEDAFPLVTLEALSSGLPVVVSDGAGTSELITQGRDGVVVPLGNASAIVDALLQLADPIIRAELGSAGRALIEEAYSWSDYGSSVLATLDGLHIAA